jgi:adenylate cyclase
MAAGELEEGPPVLALTPAVGWLLREAAFAAGPAELLAGLTERLLAEGLPVARATLSVASLDPLLAGSDFQWRRETGRIVEAPRFHGAAALIPAEPVALEIAGTGHRLTLATGDGAALDELSRARLTDLALALTAPLQAVVSRTTTQSLLQAYLGRRSAGRVLAGAARRGTGEVIEAVIWLSDLRDFTALSEQLPPDQVIAALNDSCSRLVGAIQPLGGEVLKFIGDGLLAIFPLSERGATAATAAALAALRAARAGMARLDDERSHRGLPGLPFGVALHVGAVMYGNIGAPDRLDFTAIGPAVNLASRIESLCRPLGRPVLISAGFAARCTEVLVPLGHHTLRGVAETVELFTLPEFAAVGAPAAGD